MKKILLSALAIILAMGLMGSAFAYFSDTESSTGNTFTAATLDCELLPHSPGWLAFFVLGVAPGWESAEYYQDLINLGNVAGKVYITADNFADPVDPNTGKPLELPEPDGLTGENNIEVGPKDFADIVWIVVWHSTDLNGVSPPWTPIYTGSLRHLATCDHLVDIGAAESGDELIYFKFVASLPTDLTDGDGYIEDTPDGIPDIGGNQDDNAYQADGVTCDIVFHATTKEIVFPDP